MITSSVTVDNSDSATEFGTGGDFLGLEPGQDADQLTEMLLAAVEMGESYTGRQFVSRTHEVKFSRCDVCYVGIDTYDFRLELSPVTSISSLIAGVLDASGAQTTRPITAFELLVPYGYPILRIRDSLIDLDPDLSQQFTLTAVAGYGTGAAVPRAVRVALKQHVSFLYSNRGDVASEFEDALPEAVKRSYGNIRILEPVHVA